MRCAEDGERWGACFEEDSTRGALVLALRVGSPATMDWGYGLWDSGGAVRAFRGVP